MHAHNSIASERALCGCPTWHTTNDASGMCRTKCAADRYFPCSRHGAAFSDANVLFVHAFSNKQPSPTKSPRQVRGDTETNVCWPIFNIVPIGWICTILPGITSTLVSLSTSYLRSHLTEHLKHLADHKPCICVSLCSCVISTYHIFVCAFVWYCGGGGVVHPIDELQTLASSKATDSFCRCYVRIICALRSVRISISVCANSPHV